MTPLFRSPEPVLKLDCPWEIEANYVSATGAFDDPDHGIRLYYLVRFKRSERNALCVAYSSDGVSWTKPDCGDGTNIVMRASGNPMDWGVFMPSGLVRSEDPEETMPWKMTYWDRPDLTLPPGICLAQSRDGLHWERCGTQPIITGANDAMSLAPGICDPSLPFGGGNWLIYQQVWKYNPALPTGRDNLKGAHRRIAIWKADHFDGRWVGPLTMLEPDADDPADLQFYSFSPFLLKEGGYGAFLNCHHTGDQTMDVQYVRSRDGWTWERCLHREPLLATGDAGRFDSGMVSVAVQPLLRNGEWMIFYHGRPTVHDHSYRYAEDRALPPGGGIGLARFPADSLP